MGNLEKIQKIAEEVGFDLVGIANAAISLPGQGDQQLAVSSKLDDWIKNGYHADMKWFRDSVEKRKDILKVIPEAKSVICVAMNYYQKVANGKEQIANATGRIARYARGRDYHKIFDKKLKLFSQKLKEIFPASPEHQRGEPNGEFKYYCDTGPILERAWAAKAGLGFIGKNTNLITQYGSWVLLGEVITNIDLGLDSRLRGNDKNKSGNDKFQGSCGDCRRCLDACPTGALVVLPAGRHGPYTVDARKCISYLTIEHKGEIPMELREKMGLPGQGNRIFGCDVCQEVCPFNIGRSAAASASVKTTADKKALADKTKSELTEKIIAGTTRNLKEILSIKTDEEFLEKFAGSPLMRAKRRGLVRNACVAAGNSGDKLLLPYLEECLKDDDKIIVGHAKWAIEKLGKEI